MKKNILIITYSMKIGGGAQKIISIITERLSYKYNFYILTFQNHKHHYPIKGKYYSLNVPSRDFTKISDFFKIYPFMIPAKINNHIKSISPNLIISFLELPNVYSIIAKLLFRFKVPLIISVRCNPRLQYRNESRYLNLLIRLLYPLKVVNKVLTNSKEVEKILTSDYKIRREKLQTIHNAVDLEIVNELKLNRFFDYQKIFNDNNIIKFITIGRLTNLKGHKYLIDAFFSVKKQIHNSKLFIIGDGSLKNELQKQINERGMKDDVFLLGLKKNPYKFLAKSNIFVFSSKRESFPNVLLEALACGLPIISTDCETGPRVILGGGKYGLLAKVMDSEDLKKKMIYLAKNKDLIEKYSKLSSERVKVFNINEFLNNWIELIENEVY